MVRKYKKKTDKYNWSNEQMHLAIENVLINGKSIKSSANEFGVPRTTLQKKINEKTDASLQKENNKTKVPGFCRTFTDEQEAGLARYILEMESKLLGLSSIEVRKLAFEYAERLKIPHKFSLKKQMAGKDWLHNFMERHKFAHRKAEHTSSARANGFNKNAVTEFFVLLKDVFNKYQFDKKPERIYNVDETGVSIVHKSSPRIIAKAGRRQVGGLTAGERGKNVTAEICMSAAGVFMPPLLIFPRVKTNLALMKDAPAGAWAEFHKSGYMQTDIFTRWFDKFVEFSHATPDNPVLLLLDGHSTHINNVDVIDKARNNGVVILCFPPHCTHKMQPLDVGFNGPLNRYFSNEVSSYQRPGNKVTLDKLASVFSKAFAKAAKVETATNAFKKCGIYPFNSDAFPDSEFTARDDASSISSHNSASEARIEEFQNVIQDVMNPSQKAGSTQSETSTSMNSLVPNHRISSNQTTDSNISSGDEIRIPLSYIIQAKPLIDLLSSCLQSELNQLLMDQSMTATSSVNTHSSSISSVEENVASNPTILRDNQSMTATTSMNTHNSSISSIQENVETNLIILTDNKPDEKISKKVNRKGKAAIITSDAYQENLIAETIKNIKKENVEKKVKETAVKSNDAKKSRKRKKSTPANLPSKLWKPLEDLNTNQLDLSIVNNNSASINNENYFREVIPEESIVDTQTAFFNGQVVQICYIDENDAKS